MFTLRANGRLLKRGPAPARWKHSCAHSECSLHQLSPYIGKLKSSIAGELIERYSEPGDLIADPFAGAGTIPLEAAIRGRGAFGSDISPYATVLTKAKLSPPNSLDHALKLAEKALTESVELASPDLRKIPAWVRGFFHPKTLQEALNFATICRRPGNEFFMACLLGILHHQRPGFLSFPSSHLVPYLRNQKYPPERFPQMYTYRDLRPRLLAKIKRSYKRFADPHAVKMRKFVQTSVQKLILPSRIDAIITSPPYMNALDYGRDNRLRLWFIDPYFAGEVDNDVTQRRQAFIDAMTGLARKVGTVLKPTGHCVFVIGEEVRGSFRAHPSEIVIKIMAQHAPSLVLKTILVDEIPDVRRSRRKYQGVKTEHTLVFQSELPKRM
jgi:hypothetical protein